MASTGSTTANFLYRGVHIEEISGIQVLHGYFPAASHRRPAEPRPLVLFVPGAAHYARIAYGGHAGSRPADFLAHWLNDLGYDLLGISYPLESNDPGGGELLRPDWPDLTVAAWGKLVAKTARKVMDEHRHGSDDKVILLAWSMGGRVLRSFVQAARPCRLNVQLFVSLAATPGGISGLRSDGPRVVRTAGGYARGLFEDAFAAQVQAMSELDDPTDRTAQQPLIIPRDTYLREYVGHTPPQLGIWALRPCAPGDPDDVDGSGFVIDDGLCLAAGGPTGRDYGLYPWIGAVRPTDLTDLRHVLTDHTVWGMVLTCKLTADVAAAVKPKTPQEAVWNELLDLIHSAPAQLTNEVVHGNLFFFIGERGGKETAVAMDKLLRRSQKLQQRMSELLEKLWQETPA